MESSLEGLNTQAVSYVPRRVILKPPSKPLKIQVQKQQIDWCDVMNTLFESCKTIYPKYVCKKRFTHIKIHPINQMSLHEPQPSIHIEIDSKNQYDFYYLEGNIHLYCQVELGRAPLGANLFNWSIENPMEILGGIQRVILFGGYAIF